MKQRDSAIPHALPLATLARRLGGLFGLSLLFLLSLWSWPQTDFGQLGGPAIIRADGGLDISATASPTATVDQGGQLTYTLFLTNATGVDLTNVIVTNTLPANTECVLYRKPEGWFGNPASCANGEPTWVLPDLFDLTLFNGESISFSFVVEVQAPLPNGFVLRNDAYGVQAEQVDTPANQFQDQGPGTDVTVNAPSWQIAKTVQPTSTVEAGELVDYTLTISNSGNLATAGSYIITDVLPLNTSFEASSPAPQSVPAPGGILTWTFNSAINPGQARDFTWQARVTKPLTPGTIITNTAYGVQGGNAFAGVSSSQPVTVAITSGPALVLTKQAAVSTIEPGTLLTYTLTYRNEGSNTALQPLTITDYLPPNTSFFTSTPVYSGGNGINRFEWYIPSLEIDTPQVITLVVRVADVLPDGLVLTNTATLSSAEVAGATSRAAVTVDSKPAFALSLSDQPDPVPAGDQLVYSLRLTNTGTATATGFVLTHTLDAQTAFLTAILTPDRNTEPVFGYDRPDLPPGLTATLVVTTNVRLTAQGILETALLADAAEIEPVLITQTTAVIAPAFSIRKDVTPARVAAGERLTYTITYSNNGTAVANNLRLTDTLPLSLTDIISQVEAAGFITRSGNVLVFAQTTVATASQSVITISGRLLTQTWPAVDQPLTNSLTATLDLPPLPYTATAVVQVGPTAPAQVQLQAQTNTVPIGNQVPLTVTVQDAFGNPVPNNTIITLTTTLSGSNFLPGDMQTITRLTQNGLVTATITSAQPGSSVISATVNALQTSQAITFTAARLTLSKTVDQATVLLNSPLAYTVQLRNLGAAAATGLIVTDTLPTDVTFDGATLNRQPITPTLVPPRAYVFALPDLPPNPSLSHTLRLSVTVLPSAANGQVLENRVQATAATTTSLITASAVSTVAAPSLEVHKTAAVTQAVAGESITYTITYANRGPIDATGVRLTDTLPLSFATVISTTGGNTILAGVSTNTLVFAHQGGLAFNQVETITLVGRLITSPWAAAPITLTNIVTGTLDASSVPITASVGTRVSSGPAVSLTLVATPTSIQVGQGSIVLTATTRDQYGNPAPNGQVITFSTNLPGGQLVPTQTTISNGRATASLSPTLGGSGQVIARLGALTSSVDILIIDANLSLDKTVNRTLVGPDTPFVYRITTLNNGNTPLQNVRITDTLDLGQVVVLATNPAPIATDPAYIFQFETLGAALSQTVLITVAARPETVGNIIINQASAGADDIDGRRQASAPPVQIIAGNLTLNATVIPNNRLSLGQRLTYTLRYANTDPDIPLGGIRLTTTLPLSLTDLQIEAGPAQVMDAALPTLAFAQEVLSPSTSVVLTVSAQTLTQTWPAAELVTGITLRQSVTATFNAGGTPLVDSTSVELRPGPPSQVELSLSRSQAYLTQTVRVTATVQDAYGYPVFNGEFVDFSTSLLSTTIETPRFTNEGLAVSTLRSVVSGTTIVQASARSNNTTSPTRNVRFIRGQQIDPTPTPTPTPPTRTETVYLPLILRSEPIVPRIDLLVEAVQVSPVQPRLTQAAVISVTLHNSGTVAAEDFWVDLYLTSRVITPTVNQVWSNDAFAIPDVGVLGVAWLVPELGPGERLVLTNLQPNNYSDPNDCRNYSYFTPEVVGTCVFTGNTNTFPITGTIYATAQIDSLGENPVTADQGNVPEVNERNNLFQPPLSITVTSSVNARPLLRPGKITWPSVTPGQLRPTGRPFNQVQPAPTNAGGPSAGIEE